MNEGVKDKLNEKKKTMEGINEGMKKEMGEGMKEVLT